MDQDFELDEVARRALLTILQEGLSRIRRLGWSNLPNECSIEADHLHNIPSLLMSPSLGKLEYYVLGEVPGYVSGAKGREALFLAYWEILRSTLDHAQKQKRGSDIS